MENHRLEVEGWNHMMEVGSTTQTGGYFVGGEETIEEAMDYYFTRTKISLKNGIDSLKVIEQEPDYPDYVKKDASKQVEELNSFMSILNEQTPIIYGVKVKGKVSDIIALYKGEEVVAALQTEESETVSPLYPYIPEHWAKDEQDWSEELNKK